MKLIRLTAENVKRLRAVEIEPTGNVTIIGGRNAQGKSSVLDALTMALGGGKEIPSRPIRDGQNKAKVVAELDELIVIRTFTDSGSYLKVEGKDGSKITRGQEILDRITGRLSFDPMAFTRMDASKQAETIRSMAGLDFTGIDAEISELTDERRMCGRRVKELDGHMKMMPHYPEAPVELVDISELNDRFQRATAAKSILDSHTAELNNLNIRKDVLVEKIRQLKSELSEITEKVAIAEEKIKRAQEGLSRHGDPASFADKLRDADQVNEQVRANIARNGTAAKLEQANAEYESMTEKIEKLRERKAAMIAEANLPIDGLGFDECGVTTYNGVPFSQCSQAEQIKVSFAIALATNPELPIVMIREGSLLDSDSMKLVRELAESVDAQAFVEIVGNGDPGALIIEDGQIIKR